MTKFLFFYSFLLILIVQGLCSAQSPQGFYLDNRVEVMTSKKNEPFKQLIANFLKDDIQKVFGNQEAKKNSQKIILRISNEVILEISPQIIRKIDQSLENKWEVFSYNYFQKNNINYLIISGSDQRGLAYGVFNLSEKIGISPWYFWADVPVKKRNKAFLVKDTLSNEPSVKYRGIFINDEDWGLQPWAAKTFETDLKDIGPKTYAKVFELLFRLKANLIWPAMHESTKAFYYYPQNKEVAKLYHIVVGTSHAEPMMRNNVDEWIDSTMGQYNYITNKEKIKKYWTTRIDEIKDYENLYTMGMRGKHDSGMEGIKTEKEAVEFTNSIILDQRTLLTNVIKKPVHTIPQVMTLYKEVLELYKKGLDVPDDITLIWPDDNYGYIKSLSNKIEQKRSGGGGVYYHASYWGRPHDYLWLGTTDPALLRFEMQKAYEMGDKNVWVLNVGDIKAIEYPTQLFLDMAYNMKPFLKNKPIIEHLENWTETTLGSKSIAHLLQKNYDLAFERKPEFMGWSQTEPTRQTHPTNFTLAEGTKRIEDYRKLSTQVEQLQPHDDSYSATYYQLVQYPILAAAKMNEKFLYLDQFYIKPLEQRSELDSSFLKSKAAYEDIVKLTKEYNSMNGAKWNYAMDMNPRKLPVFKNPSDLKSIEQKVETQNPILVKIPAGDFFKQANTNQAHWERITEPSFSKNALVSRPFSLEKPLEANAPSVDYQIDIPATGNYIIKVQAIPLHPISRKLGQKIALSIDSNTFQTLDFETFDRSEEWKQNVLSNKTTKALSMISLEKGKHIITLKMIDPAVLVDFIIIERR